MMKHRFAPLMLLVLALAAASCEKVIEIDDDPSQAKLVLNAIPMPGSQAFVYFARTRFFLDPSNNQPVSVDRMTLTANGTPYAPEADSNCRYFFPYTIAEGDSLTIDILSAGREVTASTVVPYIPVISDLALTNLADVRTFRFYQADFNFQDHPGLREYYALSVSVRDSGARFNQWRQTLDTVDTIHSTYFLIANSPGITDAEASYSKPMANRLYTRNLFNDNLIDGQLTPVSLLILNLTDTNEVEPFKHEYIVTLESVTPQRMQYLIDVSRQASSGGVFSEQGRVYSNVDGALGIFAAAARSRFTFCPDTLRRN